MFGYIKALRNPFGWIGHALGITAYVISPAPLGRWMLAGFLLFAAKECLDYGEKLETEREPSRG